ncbi:prolipoprotein diacylglyceryl transferase [Flavisolibacter sp. BT320]|nr:prolipoprotein diacylglyceryl transferase [Flavisolibacter longurius]
MQFPVDIQIGSLSLSLHAVLETLAFFIGFRYFLFLRKKGGDNFSTPARLWVIIGAIFGALLGSRLIGSLERPYELTLTDNLLAYFYNNKTVVGGFLGGLTGVEITKKLMGESRSSGDLFVYPMILALLIGRVGCFSMGVYEETYGLESSLPWAMNLGDGIQRHPVMLYEIGFLLTLWMVLKKVQQNLSLEPGALFKLFMINYLVFRFFVELIKPHYPVFVGLSTIQLTCAAGLLYYSPFLIHPKKLLASYA